MDDYDDGPLGSTLMRFVQFLNNEGQTENGVTWQLFFSTQISCGDSTLVNSHRAWETILISEKQPPNSNAIFLQ